MHGLSFIERMLLFYGTSLPNHPRKWWLHPYLRRIFGVSIDNDFEVLRSGLLWRLNPSDFEHESLFWLDEMDKWDIYHLQSLLSSNSVFYDIGANFGYYSLIMANHLDKKCRIHAFEPNPGTWNRLCRHIAINNMVDVVRAHRVALSDASGIGVLIERADNSGAARLGKDGQGISVDVTTLDTFCSQLSENRLDAVKIDVEGYEVRVLEGARATISRFKPVIIIEFWTPGLARAGVTVDELAELLGYLGYKLFRPIKNRLEAIVELPRGDDPVNVFAFHRDRPAASYLSP